MTTLSVIVVAHNRTRYLKEALSSVIAQDIDRTQFEVVLVKNFRNSEIDEFCLDHGILNLYTDAASPVEKLIAGYFESSGQILTFLDYDDMFHPTRLRVVLETFERIPELGFYRNNVQCVDAQGRAIDSGLPISLRRIAATNRSKLIRDDEKNKRQSSRRLARLHFNTGSMAIRRDIVTNSLDLLRRMRASADTFMFHAAWISPYSIFVDPRKLTLYRLHGGNLTVQPEFLRTLIADYAVVEQMVLNSHHPEPAIILKREAMITDFFYRTHYTLPSRTEFVAFLRNFWRDTNLVDWSLEVLLSSCWYNSVAASGAAFPGLACQLSFLLDKIQSESKSELVGGDSSHLD